MKKEIKILLSNISPKITAYLVFFDNFKRLPDFKKPKTINDKLQYLKFHNYYHNPLITQCVDKYRVRNYLKEKGYDNLLPKLYIGGAQPNEIKKKWNDLPKTMVIKCNHGCGYNLLIKDKDSIGKEDVVATLEKWIKEDCWKIYGEPQYMDIDKCVLVEENLGDNIETYKFYCFNGVPKFLYVSSNGENGEKDLYLDYYDMNLNKLDISLAHHKHKNKPANKTASFEKMKNIAKDLSKDFPFVRVDLYYVEDHVENKVFFSELTFMPTGGYMKIEPKHYLEDWCEMLKL